MSAVYAPSSKPLAVAEQIMESYRKDGHRTLVRWRGDWFEWSGPCWKVLDQENLRSRVYKLLGVAVYENGKNRYEEWSPTKGKINSVIDALEALCHLESEVEAHSWIGAEGSGHAGEYVACANALVHIPTRRTIPHTPTLFNHVAAPFDFTPGAGSPMWEEFLESIWPNDPEAVDALQEWFGYVLSSRTDLQKMALIIGPPRAGKGVVARILSALVGRGNIAGPTLSSLGQNFGLSPLIGKSLALISDARLRSDSQIVVERLLSISGEDTLTVDRKYQTPWVGTLPARVLVMSNEIPRLGDASGALANRFLTLTLRKSYVGEEDTALDARLLAELPGILNWALEGLDRLEERGHFTVPESSGDLNETLMDLGSPVSAFVAERTTKDPSNWESSEELYRQWRFWTEQNGHQPSSHTAFIRDLQAVAPYVRRGRESIRGVQTRVIWGLRL